MNDHYYKNLIIPFIPVKDRKIVSKEYIWLLGVYKLENFNISILLANLMIHTGSPCYRYCTCKFFSNSDKLRFLHS